MRLSNKIEHGSATFKEIWPLGFELFTTTARYIREAIFNIIDLDSSARNALEAAPYAVPYLPPAPPVRQGIQSTVPDPYAIPLPPKIDWFALRFKPTPRLIVFSDDESEYTVEYQ